MASATGLGAQHAPRARRAGPGRSCSTPAGAASRPGRGRRGCARPPRSARSRSGSAASTTCSSRSASSSSSSVARNACARSRGRSRMKPTVSAMMISRSRGKRSRRVVGSSVANSLSSASTSLLGQRVEQRRLAGVGVADDRDDRQPARARARRRRPARCSPKLLDLLLEPVDALARAAPVDLELGLAGAAPADAAGEAAHHRVLLVQPRQPVAQLRQLDLQLAVAALARAARRCRGSASCDR